MGLQSLLFWRLEYRKVSRAGLLKTTWRSAIGAVGIGILTFLLGEQLRTGLGTYLMLLVLWGFHLEARGYLERSLRGGSFAKDLQTGNLDQFRLLGFTPHGLIFQRALPHHLLLWGSTPIMLPVYGLWASLGGLPLSEGMMIWALTSFASYPIVWLMMVLLTMPFGAIAEPYVVYLLFATLWVLEWGVPTRKRFQLFGSPVVFLIVCLLVLLRLTPSSLLASPMPNISLFFFAWLMMEGLRYERLARWLNPPRGVMRFWWLLPTIGAMGVMFATVWEIGALLALGEAERWGLASAGVFALTGYLSLALLPTTHGRDPVLQPLRVHLTEQGWLYLLALLVTAFPTWFLGVPAPASTFWFGALSIATLEISGGGLFRTWAQRARLIDQRFVIGALLVGVVPVIMYTLLASRFPWVGLASPSVALASQTTAWNTIVGVPSIPLWWCVPLLGARWLIVLSILRSAESSQGVFAKIVYGVRHLVLGVFTALFGYPLLDWFARRTIRNPVMRLTLQKRRFDFAPLLGIATLLMNPFVKGGVEVTVLVLSAIGLWYWGYQTVWRQVRSLIDSGELNQWFLANLPPTKIFWGWVYAVWFLQARAGVAIGMAYFWSSVISVSLAPVGQGWVVVASSFLIGFLLVLFAIAIITAAPVGVHDALAFARRAQISTPIAQPLLKALGYSGFGCLCFVISPLLLTTIPYHYHESLKILRSLAKTSS